MPHSYIDLVTSVQTKGLQLASTHEAFVTEDFRMSFQEKQCQRTGEMKADNQLVLSSKLTDHQQRTTLHSVLLHSSSHQHRLWFRFSWIHCRLFLICPKNALKRIKAYGCPATLFEKVHLNYSTDLKININKPQQSGDTPHFSVNFLLLSQSREELTKIKFLCS